MTMSCVTGFGKAQYSAGSTNPIFTKPNLASLFISYSKIKSNLKGIKFENFEAIQENTTGQLFAILIKEVKEMFPSMETTLGKVCGFRRGRIERRLKCRLDMRFSFILWHQCQYIAYQMTCINSI